MNLPFGIHFDPTPGFNLGISNLFGSGNGGNNNPGSFSQIANGQNYLNAARASATSQPSLPHPNANSVPASTTSSASGSGVTYSSAPAAPAPNLNQSYIDIINGALGRLPGQEAQAEHQVHQTYDTNLNELNSGRKQAQASYNTSTAQNGQQFVTNKNQINNQASSGLRSLLSILGQHGAGGSSAALYAAPNAVATVASQQRAGAGQNFGQNQQTLDTNWNNYQTGYGNSKKQLNDWLTQQIQGAQSNSEQTKQTLLQQLVGLQPSVAAAQPYVDQINQSAAKVDALGNFNPTYTGSSPVYTAPSVASYTVKQAGAPVLGGGGNGTGSTPYLNFVLGQQKDKNQPQFAF